jgi:RsiW-degrading membrane proteinase PrsW (M82 family)
MQIISNIFRGILNVAASGLSLFLAIIVLNVTMDFPYGNPGLNDGEAMALLICAAFICLTAYLAVKFWRHRPSASSSIASSLLNGAASLLLIAACAFHFFHR